MWWLLKFVHLSRCASYAKTTGKIRLTWSPLTPCSGQESAGMAWRPVSVFSGIPLVFFTIQFQKCNLWQLLMRSVRNWLKLLETIVPTTTRRQKIVGLYVWKKMPVSTRRIKEKLLLYIKLLRFSLVTIQFIQQFYKRFAFISFSAKLPSWKMLNVLPKGTVFFFIIPICTCINSVRKILGNQIVFTQSI